MNNLFKSFIKMCFTVIKVRMFVTIKKGEFVGFPCVLIDNKHSTNEVSECFRKVTLKGTLRLMEHYQENSIGERAKIMVGPTKDYTIILSIKGRNIFWFARYLGGC